MANIDNHITSPERKHGVTALEKLLQIDIPVNLSNVKMVFSIGVLVFEGDLPTSIFHLQLIENDIADYADRNIATGNPYKDLVGDLQKRGVSSAGRPRKPINGETQICSPRSR